MNEQNSYYAFISYNSADEKWAKWLQHNLEYYHIPSALCKEYPELPKKIRPVFWYKQDLSGTKLKKALNNELSSSKYLIVICSPDSAKADWVNDEVVAFIEQGKGDGLWNYNPHKKCHKDIDARWTKKGDETFYGYKDHAKVCRKTKLIVGYDTTPASVHDSQRGAELVDCNDIEGKEFWLDAGYVGTEDGFAKRGVTPIICEKGFRGHPLCDEQKQCNRTKSKVRSRVEHVFGFIVRSMGGLVFRGIGIVRAKANVAMTNLTYNIARLAQIFKYHKSWITA